MSGRGDELIRRQEEGKETREDEHIACTASHTHFMASVIDAAPAHTAQHSTSSVVAMTNTATGMTVTMTTIHTLLNLLA